MPVAQRQLYVSNYLSILFVSFIFARRPQYFKIIEECVSQIVLHRSGTDPDFSYRKRLDVDFSHLLGKLHNFDSFFFFFNYFIFFSRALIISD